MSAILTQKIFWDQSFTVFALVIIFLIILFIIVIFIYFYL